MAFGGFERGVGPSQPMAEINVTPMVDVMLVLLVIFIITAPLLSYAIRVDLPNEPAAAVEATPAIVHLSIDPSGAVYWEAEAVADAALAERLREAGRSTSPPEVHIRADKATRFERVAFVMSAAQQAGLLKIGFVTEPAAASSPPAPK